VRSGKTTFTCSAPTLGITDPTPAVVQIAPGPATAVHTTVDVPDITAGGVVNASCEASDAFGNTVATSATLSVTPGGGGPDPTGLSVQLTHTGDYQLSCEVPGATSDAALVHVDPALPASLTLTATPSSAVTPVGQELAITYEARDVYGNSVTTAVTLDATALLGTGPIVVVDDTHYRFDGEGTYAIEGTVVGDTAGGAPVTGLLQVNVDSLGPAVTCTSPAANGVVVMTPATAVTLQGSVADAHGVKELVVNGSPTTVGADGSFSAPLTSRYGLNYVAIDATDDLGTVRHELCTFLVADRFVDEGALLDASIMLRMGQASIDDNSRAGGVNSLDDILFAIINSQDLHDTVHAAFVAANPLKPSSCDQQVCVFGACACVLSSQIRYVSWSRPGPNTVTATLVDGGIAVKVRFEDPSVSVRVNGAAAGIAYDTTGPVNYDYATVELTFDVGVDGAGRPNISIRANSVASDVVGGTPVFTGLDGYVLNIVTTLAQGTIKNILKNTLTNYVTSHFNSALDGIVSGLDVATLGTSRSVPRLDATGSVVTNFGIGFSSINTNPTRLLVGMGTRFTGPAAHAREPHRAPLPPFSVFVDPNAGGQPVAVADHVGLFDQALQALWRGGWFDASFSSANGSSITLTTMLPPVLFVRSGSSLGLDLGGIEATVSVPGVLDGVHARAGLRASAVTSLAGNALAFAPPTLEELNIVAPDANLDDAAMKALTDALTPVLTDVVSKTFGQGIPPMPIPTFPIPASLATYGFSGQLGITGPTLSIADPELLLRGGFGIRP
jgi:hypothetical protein